MKFPDYPKSCVIEVRHLRVKDLVHEEYHNLEQELRRLTTQWTNELTEREEKFNG